MLNVILRFFQICGLQPVDLKFHNPPNDISPESKVLKLWSLIHFLVVVAVMISAGLCKNEIFYGDTVMGNISDILLMYSNLFAHLSIIAESFSARKYIVKYMQFYAKIDCDTKWHKRVFMKILFPVIFSIVIEIVIITHITDDRKWTKFVFLQAFSLFVTRVRFLQQVFFVDVIFYSLESLNFHLKSFIAAAVVDKNLPVDFLYKNIKKTKEDFVVLMKLLICVNKIFCWSQALNIGQLFVEAISDIFWIYVHTRRPSFGWGLQFTFKCFKL